MFATYLILANNLLKLNSQKAKSYLNWSCKLKFSETIFLTTESYKNYYSKQRRMLYTYVTRGSFYGGLNISDNYRFKKNVPVCAVYRLSLCNKKYLFKHASNAKALIY